MSDLPKKRPWLQFHLSTAIVLMFVAGGLLWENIQPFDSYIVWCTIPVHKWAWGFPFCYLSHWERARHLGGSEVWNWFYVNLVLDILVSLAILFAVAVLCEWRIRCKERLR